MNGKWMTDSGNIHQVPDTWTKYVRVLVEKQYVYGTWLDRDTRRIFESYENKITSLYREITNIEDVPRKIETTTPVIDKDGALENVDNVIQHSNWGLTYTTESTS